MQNEVTWTNNVTIFYYDAERQLIQQVQNTKMEHYLKSDDCAFYDRFVFSLQTLEPLPKRQEVAVLPKIEWKGYVDSLQQVARQNSSIYLNTRRQGRPQLTLDEKPVRDVEKQVRCNAFRVLVELPDNHE